MPTEQELLESGRFGFVEVHRGQVVTPPPTTYIQNRIAGNIYQLLSPYTGHGFLIAGQTSVVLAQHNHTIQTLRVPHLAYIAGQPTRADTFAVHTIPRLVVHIVAPHESPQMLEMLILDYQNAGTDTILLVYPERNFMLRYSQTDEVTHYSGEDRVILDNIFPMQISLKTDSFLRQFRV